MSTKEQDDYDEFGRLPQYARWKAFKSERDRADKAEAALKETRFGRACVCGRWVRGLGYEGPEA